MNDKLKSGLSKEEMFLYFEEINKRLAEIGKHGEIMMAGGATLALVHNARNSTHDIDALFAPSEDMRKIIKDIATEYGLDSDWMNDGVKGFVTPKMKFDEFQKYSNLTVSNINAEGLLAMKLTAARVDTKDVIDCIFLMNVLEIRTEKQAFDIINKYTSTQSHTPKVKFFTMEVFQQYAKEHKLDLEGKESINFEDVMKGVKDLKSTSRKDTASSNDICKSTKQTNHRDE